MNSGGIIASVSSSSLRSFLSRCCCLNHVSHVYCHTHTLILIGIAKHWNIVCCSIVIHEVQFTWQARRRACQQTNYLHPLLSHYYLRMIDDDDTFITTSYFWIDKWYGSLPSIVQEIGHFECDLCFVSDCFHSWSLELLSKFYRIHWIINPQ